MAVAQRPALAAASVGRSSSVGARDLALLVGLLVAVALVIGPGTYTVDEQAYRTQARWVAEDGRWSQPYAVPDLVDGPEPAPLALSTRTDGGWAPYSRAPLYIVLLVPLVTASPTWGPIALSLLGLIGAAVAVARLAARLDPAAARPAFWLFALGTPYLVHGHIAWAHTLLGAAAGAALLALLEVSAGRGVRWGWALLAVLAIALGVLLRTEGLLVGAAAVAGLAADAAWTRRRQPAVAAGAAGAGLVLGHLANSLLVGLVIPAGAPPRADTAAEVGVDLLHSAWNNLVAPGFGAGPATIARLVSMAALVALALRASRSGPDAGAPRPLALVVVATGVVGSLALDPYLGLLPASPLLALAVVALRRGPIGADVRRLLLIGGPFLVGVLLGSYPDGGGLGWGGRFLLVLLVLATPLVAVGALAVLRVRTRPLVALGVAAVLVTGAVQLSAVRLLRELHAASVEAAPLVDRDLAELAEERRLLVTTDIRIGRIAPDSARHLPLLSAGPEELGDLLAAIDERGLRPPLLLTLDERRLEVPDGWRVVSVERLRLVAVAHVEPVPS